MSKYSVLRAALGVVAVVGMSVALQSQADARLFGGRHHGGCGCAAEPSCGCAAEPSCGCAVEEPSCCVVEEPSCGCEVEPSCGCSSRHARTHRLFGRRNRGCGGCESSCGAPVECGCGAPAEAAPMDGATPPAPEAPTT